MEGPVSIEREVFACLFVCPCAISVNERLLMYVLGIVLV